ncbi:PREDICTED: uncharacterized protein LOC18604777 isoform X1 [Theobroma cacao]|uniref:Uncharacterized protein LOC18604777 isoform X1 n=1 Tax=Theobroma cacao TaxID=3641 RepID=A0AB32W0M7_THECC|nr:PREDICTED: uncharacterized protein LOC18604777 isoform X1 [Theobroma cacao]XP_017972446.1 PREDICTED: uncharacterized protein LOC18604777 isoform X1 [Theobroma cacao]
MEPFFSAILRKQNWFQRQFSSQNSQSNHPIEGAHEAAVAAAAFAIQSLQEAKATKLKTKSRKDNGRNAMLHSKGTTSQFSYKKTKIAVDNSKKKPMEQKTKEFEGVYSAAKPSSKSAVIPIAPGDNAEWYDKLKSVVACGSVKMLRAKD